MSLLFATDQPLMGEEEPLLSVSLHPTERVLPVEPAQARTRRQTIQGGNRSWERELMEKPCRPPCARR